MNTYALHITQVGETGSEGAYESVMVYTNGQPHKGASWAHIALEGHDGRPHCCTVIVPPCDLVDRGPLARFASHNHLTSREGVRYFTFATRREALAFLASLYGITAPQPAVQALQINTHNAPKRLPQTPDRNESPIREGRSPTSAARQPQPWPLDQLMLDFQLVRYQP